MSSNDTTSPTLGRRTVLRLLGGAAVSTTALGGITDSARAQSGSDLDSWFAQTSNYDGVVDETGRSTVTVTVGSQANGGAFGFGPAAVRVDPGTTVVWEWSGKGGSHNVAAEDGSFESDLVSAGDHTFEHTFEEAGTYTYACTPHKTLGMKGAVVVTDDEGGSNAQVAEPFGDPGTERLGGIALAGTFGAMLASPALFGAFIWLKGEGGESAGETYPKGKSE